MAQSCGSHKQRRRDDLNALKWGHPAAFMSMLRILRDGRVIIYRSGAGNKGCDYTWILQGSSILHLSSHPCICPVKLHNKLLFSGIMLQEMCPHSITGAGHRLASSSLWSWEEEEECEGSSGASPALWVDSLRGRTKTDPTTGYNLVVKSQTLSTWNLIWKWF